MATLSISETTTFRWSLEEDVASYAAAGIPSIGIWRRKLSDCGTAAALAALKSAGLRVSHLFWAGGFTGSDGRSHRESVDDAIEAVRTAAELDCSTLALCSGSRVSHTASHARRLLQSALAELAPVAAEQKVTLAIEPMHPGCAVDWTFLTSIDETLDLLQSVASPQVKMVLDTYHLGFNGRLLERMPELAPYIAIVQLGDARRPPSGEQNRCRLGDGVVPLADIIAALKTAGYDGYYDVELLGEEIETCDYRWLLQHAKEAFARFVMY
jgi:sugar phosphate isomerase/epimerase